MLRELLDQLLASGQYRIGDLIVSGKYLLYENAIYSILWTRLPLKGFEYKKSQKRRLKKTRSKFEIEVKPFIINDEYREAYLAYTSFARGERHENLDEFVGNDDYNTYIVEYRDGGKLAGYSLFDVGLESIQSLIGVYYKEYAKYGLGVATVLEEISWAKAHNMSYHYSGYVLPYQTAMSYKLDLGDLEVYHKEKWILYKDLPQSEYPLDKCIFQLQKLINEKPEELSQKVYEYFSLAKYNPRFTSYLDEPVFVSHKYFSSYIIVYDTDEDNYQLIKVKKGYNIGIWNKSIRKMELYKIRKIIFSSKNYLEMLDFAQTYCWI